MKASLPHQRRTGKWCKVILPSENMAAVAVLLRQAGPLMGAGNPVAAHAFRDTHGRWRRVHATFADGWRATLVLYADGTGSLSQALKLASAPIAGVL